MYDRRELDSEEAGSLTEEIDLLLQFPAPRLVIQNRHLADNVAFLQLGQKRFLRCTIGCYV